MKNNICVVPQDVLIYSYDIWYVDVNVMHILIYINM